jgi:hypothetical protein
MAYYKLNTDGTIQSRSKQVDDTWKPLSELETKENGEYYTYYNEDGTADLEKEMKADMDNLFQSIESSIQKHLDETAKANGGWDNMMSARAGAKPISDTDTDIIKNIKENAHKLDDYYFKVWAKAYELQESMTEVPTVESVLEQLPKFE